MEDSLRKAMLKVAASSFGLSELRTMLKFIHSNSPEELLRQIERLRGDAVIINPSSDAKLKRSQVDQDRLKEFSEVIRKIERLLVTDAGLSKSMATKVLYEELHQRFPNKYLATPNKVAFDIWMARTLDDFPASEVLHIATKIRNSNVHGSATSSNWPLGSPKR
jgi:hypothetical protein